jgi:CheY-like chemotaxis protein
MARVLVVDDTDILRKALEIAIRRMGHTVHSASDARTALALALEEPPDLALVDFRMPGMDGAELFEALRDALRERCPRVLFVTATPASEVAARLERIGPPDGYVKKPFHLDDLMRTVADALAAPARPPVAAPIAPWPGWGAAVVA